MMIRNATPTTLNATAALDFDTIKVTTGGRITDPSQSVIFCGQFNTCPSVPLPTPAFALV